MQFSKVILAVVFGVTYVAADATILFCNQDNCSGSCSQQTVVGDGACHQLGGIESAKTIAINSGCSVSVYTDPNCSDGATAVDLGVCIAFDPGLKSFSYDC